MAFDLGMLLVPIPPPPPPSVNAFLHFLFCNTAPKEGTEKGDKMNDAAIAGEGDGSIILAGATYGDWNGANAGDSDFAAVKMDADSNVLWRWQVKKRD